LDRRQCGSTAVLDPAWIQTPSDLQLSYYADPVKKYNEVKDYKIEANAFCQEKENDLSEPI
jgi:hypothetical protein